MFPTACQKPNTCASLAGPSRMARYFFNLRYGSDKLAVDPEGDEIPNDALVREHALGIARKMLKTPLYAIRDWMTCTFEVMDQDQQLVCIVPFTDLVVETADSIL